MRSIDYTPTRAQESRAAIQRLHVAMKHLFIRGSYKPLGVSGEAMIAAMQALKPEIYGSINDPEKVELTGLLYIFQRLPIGIESCRYIKLIGKEGYDESHFTPIVPDKRRRNCYRIDEEQMYIEMTRGRSDIYDVLTHLTFMYIESEKIMRNALTSKRKLHRDWKMLELFVKKLQKGEEVNMETGYAYLSKLLGRTYEEVVAASKAFEKAKGVNSLFHITYWLGKRSIEEELDKNDREITFSSFLRERSGHHIYGENWANQIKEYLYQNNLLDKEIHIISSNLHSVMNSLYGHQVLKGSKKYGNLNEMAQILSKSKNKALREKVLKYARVHGLEQISDKSGTNIIVQVIDLSKVEKQAFISDIKPVRDISNKVIVVMDYAFGEQAYESMDELLKPYEVDGKKLPMNIKSVNIMGKAGILEGKKGDIMIPTAHIFEGSADNYPVDNHLIADMLDDEGIDVYTGSMVTVLGTSLQNKDVLRYFLKSSWGAVGLEMEGAHYQKAIQSASKIRKSISENVITRYAYYASDNPLETGSTLASGSLGLDGVHPTYLITKVILNEIFKR